MNVKLRYLSLLAGAVLLALVGCAPEAEAPTAPEEEAPASLTARAPILSDEDVMATMTCEEFDAAGLEKLRLLGLYERAVSVEVGEVEGTTWWVVVGEGTSQDGGDAYRDGFLTDVLALDDFSDGTWIRVGTDDGWRNVDWDDDMLTRAQSALTLAKRTLAGS